MSELVLKKYRVLKKKSHRKVLYIAPLICLSLLLSALYLFPDSAKAQDDYTFGTELVNKGYSANPTEKHTENAVYNSLQEADQYPDTNFSGSSENVVTGTAGGSAFPGALDTDDASRRTYTEANAGGGSPTYQVLRPTADGSVTTMVEYPVSPTTHYDKVDETTAGGDTDTTYLEGVTNAQESELGMADPSDPGGSPDIDVIMWHISRGESTSSCTVVWGIEIGGVEYQGGSTAMTSITYANFSYEWTTNPVGGEWTLSAVNGLETYVRVTDANPDTRTTQVGLVVEFNPTASYTLDAQITYNSVASTSQTTGFQVLCQGYRTGDTENVNVQAWNYTSSAWVTKVTISAGSDTDYNFNLLGWAANCERSSGNVVLLRLVDASGGDATQTIAYLDVLKVQRIDQGYWLNVELTSTTVAEYGNVTVRIKGYTSAESFHVDVWNYTSGAYDTNKLTISSLSNAWQTTVDLVDASHRSSQTVKIRLMDDTNYTADTTADILYLDVAWVSRYHTDPTITLYGALPQIVGSSQAIGFFANYSDYDNDAPTFMYVNIDTSDFSLTKNDTGDVSYHNGVNYSLSKSDLSLGEHTYYFRTQDASSGVVTTSSAKVYINATPALSGDTVFPATGNVGDSFNFSVVFNDTDGDMPTYVKAFIDSTDYTCLESDSLDLNTVDGKGYYYNKVMSGGDHTYLFKTKDAYSPEISTTSKNLHVNNIPVLSAFGRTPVDPVYSTTLLNFTCTFTDADNDLPSSIKWRENGGAVQNVTMNQTDSLDVTTTDGKDFYITFNLGHGAHSYDYWASDGMIGTSGGSNSITIENRAPTIDNKFVDTHQWRNTYWEYDYAYTDLDGDTVVFQMSTNASFLSINSASGLVYGTTSDPVGWYDTTVWCNDSYSGSDSDSFVLYVDNRVPVITNGPGANPSEWRNTFWSYDFNYTDADSDSVVWEKSGALWLTIVGGTGVLSGTTTDTPGAYPFTVYANDSYGGSANYPFTLSINNRAPVISSSGNTTQTEGTYLAYHILATDADGDVLSYALSTNASWATISGAWVNGTATGVGWYNFQVWANDSYSGSDTKSWQLTVTSANSAPYFTSTPIYSVANNSAYLYNANATDPNEDPITYGLVSNCSWLEINPSTRAVSGTPHQAGSYYVNVTASDGINPPAYQNYTLYVTSAAPSFTSSPIDEWQNNTFYSYNADATDSENEYLNFSLEGNATGFLSIHQYLGYVNGTAPYVGWYLVNISVFDGVNIAWQNFTLYSLNTAPTITSSPVLIGTPGVNYYYNALATDINNDTIQWAATENPVWLVVDPTNGQCTGIPVIEGNYDVKLVVWDGTTYSWQNWTIVVVIPATPPVTPPADIPNPGETNPAASFKYTVVNNKIIVEDTSFGSTTRRQWDFGDGVGSQDAKVTHAYLKPGDYTITLTVWNGAYSSKAQITLHIGSADEWRIEKGNVTWEITTPLGGFGWSAPISVALGIVLLIMSFGGQRFPILKSKYVRALGIILLVVGVAFYAS